MVHRKYAKALALAGLLGVLTLAPASSALAAVGWDNSSGQWMYYDANGILQKGWLRTTDGTYYYMDLSTGKMCTGWKQIDNKWYYFRANGSMVANSWITDNGSFYYLYEDGTMVTGWMRIGETYYYMKASGAMTTGWVPLVMMDRPL